MANISVNSFTFKSVLDKGTITVTVFADGKQIKDLEFSAAGYTIASAEASVQFSAENFGILGPGNVDLYEKGKSTPPPTQEVSATTVYKYDIKKYGPQKYIVVYEIRSTGEKQIFEGNKLIGVSDDNLIQTAKLGLQGQYPGVVNMTRKTPAPSPVPTTESPITPPPSSLPEKLQTTDPPKYLPQAKYKKAKKTPGKEFIVKATGEDYRGSYIETYKKQYFAGETPEQNGVELEKLERSSLTNSQGNALFALGLSLLALLQSAFKKQLTQDEINKGIAKRYFVQDNRDKKISETSEDLFEQGKKDLPSFTYTEVPWHISNPVEDIVINGIKFQGSESRNKEIIKNLENTVPGISKFVTDYRYLTVDPPTPPTEEEVTAQTQVIKDPNTAREEFNKASFDLRK
jgi:hypothetical protein